MMNSRASVATPCIFLKLKEKPSSVGKRVVLPKTLEGLKRQARILLQSPKPILSFFDEHGEQILCVEQLIPNTVVYASSVAGQQERVSVIAPPQNHSRKREPTQEPANPVPKYEIKKLNIPDMHQGLLDLDSGDLSSEQQRYQDYEEEEDNLSFLAAENTIKSAELENDDLTTPEEENEPENEEVLATEEAEEEQPLSEALVSDVIEEEEEPVEDGAAGEEEDVFTYENVPNTEEEETEVSSQEQEILAPQYCNDEIAQTIDSLLQQNDPATEKPYRELFAEILKESQKEERIIFQKTLANLPCCSTLVRRTNITLMDALKQRAEEIISRHRIVEPGLVAHNLHSVIVGPRGCGKSLLLGFAVERLLISMFKSQTHKHNFVLVFDAKKLANNFESFQQFYNAFVELVFNAIAAQRPGFAQFSEAVISYFKGIGSGANEAALPKRFTTHEQFKSAARSLAQLGMQLQKCYAEPDAFEAWHTNVLLMPSLVASAFGFSQVHYIIDNAEYLDGTISPEFPFVESEDPVDITEYFKYAISTASYLMACEDFDEFMRVFGPKEDSINLIKNATFVDTFGMEGAVQGADKAFMLKFQGDPRMFRFSVEDCCGCPAFLSFWEEIAREVDATRDPWDVPIDEYNESQIGVKEMLTHLLKEVFVVNEYSDESAKIVSNEIVEIRPIKSVA